MTTATQPATGLDRRRATWIATVQAATDAAGALAVLEGELEATAEKREASRAELAAAVDRAAELERELKAVAKQRKRLRSDRAKAQLVAKKSCRRAKDAEKKFDRALLKDMLHKAKQEALSEKSAKTPAKAAPRRRTTTASRPKSTT